MRDALRKEFHLHKGATEKQKKLPALYWGIQHNVPSVDRVATQMYLKHRDSMMDIGLAPERMKKRAEMLKHLLDLKILSPFGPVFYQATSVGAHPGPEILQITPLQQAVLDVTHVELAMVLIRAGAPWAPWTEAETMPFHNRNKPRSNQRAPRTKSAVQLDPTISMRLSPLEIVLLHQGHSFDRIQARCKTAIRLVLNNMGDLWDRKLFLDPNARFARTSMVVDMISYLVTKGKLNLEGEKLSGAIFRYYQQGQTLEIADQVFLGMTSYMVGNEKP
ncbi:hypothetical protein B0T21DRAFT_414790 [Apiosordaria backusii]|uniref:Uncharacterized protein n=1 Tax=Apiosordaria backusii TaxID=314023 RepID=A0AA40AMW3_9PEZI|nr:hypothetical protein B0T21DRAFT_414790 [Apiosordaria backusii]